MKKRNRKAMQILCSMILGVSLCIGNINLSFAASETDSFNEAKWETLRDNNLEYGEIEDLIIAYNPMYSSSSAAFYSTVSDYENLAAEMKKEASSMTSYADDLTEIGDADADTYRANAAALRTTAKTYESTVKNITSKTSTMGLTQAKAQLTQATQSIMMSYCQLAAQRPVVVKSCELSKAALDAANTQRGLGLATDADVLSAQKSLISAQKSLENVDNSIAVLKQNLCLMTGWSYDASPNIGEIPAITDEMISAIDPEADKVTAIGNNYDLRSQRQGKGNVSEDANKARDAKLRTMDETEEKVRSSIDTLYQAIQQKRIEYGSKLTAYQNAESNKAAADRQYALGLVSRLQYMQLELAYLSAKAAYESASITLYQAYETYEWAVKGLISSQS